MTVREAFNLFSQENSDIKNGKSKFASMRPKHVLPMSDLPQNVCLCQTHENMNLLLQACNEANIDLPRSSSDLVKQVVCDERSVACMLKCNCDTCGDGKILQDIISALDDEVLGEVLTWYQWQTAEGRVTKILQEGTVLDLVHSVYAQLQHFLGHTFIKRKQSAFFEEVCHMGSADSAVIQVDFSENYSVMHQDEIQSANWHHEQVTVFTCVSWVDNICHSYTIVSDYLSHEKLAVYRFLGIILSDIKQKLLNLNRNICLSI